jgi:hypothetical protein
VYAGIRFWLSYEETQLSNYAPQIRRAVNVLDLPVQYLMQCINNIAGYSDLGGLHALVVERLHIFINIIAGYSDLAGASCPGDRGIICIFL